MKVLISPDKFKGTLSASQAADAIAEGVAQYNPNWVVQILPIADGGEGTAEVLTKASGGSFVTARASDPLLQYVGCQYGISADGKTAFIDLAEASGLQRLQTSEVNAFKTSTIGTGQLIVHALSRKCSQIVLGLGGSATMDCGTGIAHALGIVFQDEFGQLVSPIGANLGRIEFVQVHHRNAQLDRAKLILLADVDNPLLGEDGAIVYAAQKGVKEDQAVLLHANLYHFANLMEASFGVVPRTPGLGAAGGAALSCMALLGGKLAKGVDFVLSTLNVQQAIADADLVITGEGHLDEQSLRGKAVIGLAAMAQKQGKPVLAVCGQISLMPFDQIQAGISLSGALFTGGEDPTDILKESYRQLVTRTKELLGEMAAKLK